MSAPPKRVEVRWKDALSVGRWRSRSEALAEANEDNVFEQHCIGYLLALTDEYVLLAMNYKGGSDDLVADTMQIPRSEVLSIQYLRVDKSVAP